MKHGIDVSNDVQKSAAVNPTYHLMLPAIAVAANMDTILQAQAGDWSLVNRRALSPHPVSLYWQAETTVECLLAFEPRRSGPPSQYFLHRPIMVYQSASAAGP